MGEYVYPDGVMTIRVSVSGDTCADVTPVPWRRTVRVPDGVKPGEKRPAFIVMHGFGSNSSSSNVLEPCAMFEKLGVEPKAFYENVGAIFMHRLASRPGGFRTVTLQSSWA